MGSCRRDLLDHIVALNERHLKRLLSEYVRYHHGDRTHLGLEKGTPDGRIRSVASGRILSQERLGGLHHVTIERPRPDRLFRWSFIYICALHVHSGSCPSESFMLYRGDNRIQDCSTKNRRVFGLGSSFGEPQHDTSEQHPCEMVRRPRKKSWR